MSGKVRVYEVAKQLNLDPKAVVGLFQAIGVTDVRNHMSSVEPEAVERVKRHLEKAKTHDVVEERIRPTVVKRRAVAKPAQPGDVPSSAALPAPAPSSRMLDVPESRGSSSMLESAHVAADRPSTRERDSSRFLVPEPPRKSSRTLDLAPPPPMPPIPAAAPSRPKSAPVVPAPPPSIPRERSSARLVHVAASEEVSRHAVDDVAAAAVPAMAEPTEPSAPPVQRAPEPQEPMSFAEAMQAETAFLPPPSTEPEPPVFIPPPPPPPTPLTHRAAGPARPSPAPVPEAPAPTSTRPSSPPKTGVEYWTGRPGVPMSVPSGPSRMGGLPPGGANMPRRVQYDPRASAPVGGPPRGNIRTPGGGPHMGGGRPMQGGRPGQGGPQGRRGFNVPMRRPTGIVSTQEMSAHKKVIRIEENITLQGMAQKLSLKSTELLMKLLSMGMTGVHINTTLDSDTAKILASEFGWEVEDVAKSEEENIAAARGEETEVGKPAEALDPDLVVRSPVVTVMGHVDHGKTSLLDRIRKANVAGGEAGGITQHIGAYKVTTAHGATVFLDTPGHEAFTQMRARGASVTDLVVLVVAADDGVMPQTKEALNHAKAAKVPIIVAVNKIDKPAADPERVRRELVDLGLQPEEWGGDTMFLNVSAHTGEGVDQLLEAIALQAEVLELRANPKRAASGTVLEALLDRGRGPVARVLVQDGTLRVGDFVLAGPGFGKVRAMTNEHGKQVHEAGPATPVEILGLSDVPNAGDPMHAVKDAKKAQEIADSRRGKMAKSLIPATAKVSLEELSKRISDTNQQELRIIVKGDVQGSVEAVAEALAKLTCEKARLLIIHAGVGAITEGDINLAIASKAIIVGFNVRPAGKAGTLAEENKIEIRLYSIIYNAVDDIRSAMEGLLPPTLVEKVQGRAEVRMVFKVKNQVIAGSFVTQGKVLRNGKMRVIRDGVVLFDGKVDALKRFKDDVKDVVEGFECGISLDGFNDIKEKDILESYEIEEIKQRL